MAKLINQEYERIRATYRPRKVNMLFVGESRPASGEFFYIGNSTLLRHTRNVFERFLNRSFDSPEVFLDYFQRSGFFLDDLCLEPVNHFEKKQRKQARLTGVPGLTARIKDYSPRTVICIMKAIQKHVEQAVTASGIRLATGILCVPFPAMNHQPEYESELFRLLRSLDKPNDI